MARKIQGGAALPVALVDENADFINGANPLETTITNQSITITDDWTVELVSDETANDNDKVLTVPAGQEYQVLWLWVEYAADANAGARQIQADLRDGANDVIGQFRPGETQDANETRYYMFAPSLADLTDFRDTDYLMTPFPPTVFLPAGYDIRIFDNNNVSGTDDMVIQMMVARRP